VERFVQVKLLAKPLHHLLGELGIQRIYLAGFTRSQMDDSERDYRNKEESDQFLH
jgi:hypothetical protein